VAHITHAAFAQLQGAHQPHVVAELSCENIHVLPFPGMGTGDRDSLVSEKV
jgi:hypothetical protein